MNHVGAVRGHMAQVVSSVGPRGVIMCSGLAAMGFGLALPGSSWDAIALLMLFPLGLAAPTATLLMILAITVLVPWGVQDHFKVLADHGERGVLFLDALVLIALVRTAWLIARRRVEFDLPMLLGTVVAAVLAAATLWGIARGSGISAAGNEGRRVLFGACAFLLSWPLLKEPGPRRIVARGLVGIGMALGIWGLAQWLFNVDYSTTGDVGVRGGLSSAQLQGGMYAYPVAIVLAWAALIGGWSRSVAAKALLAGVLALNTICLLLTIERTLMIATVLGCAFVLATYGPAARRSAIRWGAVIAPVLMVASVVIGGGHVNTALERLALVGNLESDNSYTHRIIEADVMTKQIIAQPLSGSGFGATVTWGLEDKFAINTTAFADLGYHWLAWKAGLPAAALIVAILMRGVFRRPRGYDSRQWQVVRSGARGALLALLIISLLFGVFNALGITAVIGLLVAVCYSAPTGSQLSSGSRERRREHLENIDMKAKSLEGMR